ncbi:CHAP domain-containing protein [Streptomyces sp. AP-93]|uniref:CHAP domain-containing protein n=1 Tax=Streptomyces sp. AP-93 TaxID=2929048 RepID=UPI001FAF3D86|nr:CHAP domain-containing protein [Streptomyces sp. AP-93]MCJ0871896.1 CHAP domain-containing protein [Streptomyces sp. AP-93]
MPSSPSTTRRRAAVTALAALTLTPLLGLATAGTAHADSTAVASIAKAQTGKGCSSFYGCPHPGQWCADFARWVWSQAGATPMTGIDSRAVSFYQFGKSNGTLHSTPQVGDAVVYDADGSLADGEADHVNLVVEVSADGTQIKTVGGNESNSVQARSWFNWRTNSSPVGAGRALAFVGPKGLGAPPTPAPTQSTYRGDIPISGDWDGRGHTQVGVFRNSGGANQFILRHDDGSISVIALGDPGDQPITGDWDGTGHTQVGVFRNSGGANQFILRHDDGSTSVIALGDAGDQPIIGDWEGTGRAQVGVFRNTGGANEFIMRHANGSLNTVLLGDRGDQPVIGHWDGGARDLPGIFRRSSSGGANTIAALHADGSVTHAQYGNPGDLPVIGDWSGAGRSSYGIYRPGNATFSLSNSYAGAADTSFIYGNGGTWS